MPYSTLADLTRFLPTFLVASSLSLCRPTASVSARQSASVSHEAALGLAADPAAGSLEVVWLGTAGLYLSDGKSALLIDPFVSHYDMIDVAMRRDLAPKMDLIRSWVERLKVPAGTPVVVTHSHYDHALDAPYFAQVLDGALYGSGSTAFIGIGAGLPEGRIKQVEVRSPVTIGEFRLTFIESCHGAVFAGIEPYPGNIEAPLRQPTSANEYKTGHVYSVLIEHPRGRFLHHASPCTLPGMFHGERADTVFLGIYGRDDSLSVTSAVVDAVSAKRVVPIHWDDFFLDLSEPTEPMIGVDLEEFRETLRTQRADLEVQMLEVGQVWQNGVSHL